MLADGINGGIRSILLFITGNSTALLLGAAQLGLWQAWSAAANLLREDGHRHAHFSRRAASGNPGAGAAGHGRAIPHLGGLHT
jgi:hypothetical protein